MEPKNKAILYLSICTVLAVTLTILVPVLSIIIGILMGLFYVISMFQPKMNTAIYYTLGSLSQTTQDMKEFRNDLMDDVRKSEKFDPSQFIILIGIFLFLLAPLLRFIVQNGI